MGEFIAVIGGISVSFIAAGFACALIEELMERRWGKR